MALLERVLRVSVGCVLVLCIAGTRAMAGPVFVDCGDRDDHGHYDGTNNVNGWKLIEQAIDFTYTNATNGGTGVLVIGPTGGEALDAATHAISALGLSKTVITGTAIDTTSFAPFRVIYVPSSKFQTSGGITDADNDRLVARKADVQAFVNGGGGLVMLTQTQLNNPYGALELPLAFAIDDESFTGSNTTLFQTPELAAAGFSITDAELSAGTPVHCDFVGPPGFNGLKTLIVNDDNEIITLGGGSETHIGGSARPAPAASQSGLFALVFLLAGLGVRKLGPATTNRTT